jgi:NitT/TauT family transport system ATP-binding protein
MTLLSVSHLRHRFANGLTAIADIDFTVADGECVTLLGPSGCGKSTLLRLIAGLEQPSAGAIAWAGGTRPPLGFVFQDATLMPWADALANVRLAPALQGAPDARVRAAEALARVGLAGFEKSLPHQLSGGMRMRVSIARALAARPRLLLLDEPFAALDEMTRAALNDDLLALAREAGITVLFVTHSVAESVYLSDRVLVMRPRPGRIVETVTLPPRPRDRAYRLSSEFLESQRQVADALQRAAA